MNKNEIKSDIRPILDACKQTVRSIVPGASVILYGSRARGDERPDSDVDLLVLINHKTTQALIKKIRHALYDIELNNDIIISSIVRSREEWNSDQYQSLPLHHAIDQEGIYI